MIDPLSSLFVKVLPSLSTFAGKQALKRLYPPVDRAIRGTAKDFPTFPGLSDWLKDWCASPEFFELQSALREGERVGGSLVAESLTRFIGKVSPEHAARCAEEVLPVFLRRVDEEEFGSTGLAILDHRAELRHADVLEGQREVAAAVAALHSRISVVVPPLIEDSGARAVEEKALDSQLDDAKRLIDSGLPKGANEILRTLRPKIEGTQVSTGLRFRLEALTGSFWLATRQPGPAEKHLSLAVSLDPKNARARANLSTARAMIGLAEDALEDARNALALAASDGYVASVYVRRLAESGCTSELENFVRAKQDDDLSDPYLLGAIADALCDAGRTKDVVAIVAPRAKRELAYAPAWDALGRALLTEAQKGLQAERVLPWQMPDSRRQMLEEAEQAFSQVIDLVEQIELDTEMAVVYLNRAACRATLGRSAESETDCDKALHLKPELDEANRAKALLLVGRREYNSAVQHLRRISAAGMSDDSRSLLGLAYLGAGQPREAIAPLLAVLHFPQALRHQKISAADMLAQSYRQLDDLSACADIVRQIVAMYPDDAEALCIDSRHKEDAGDINGARAVIEKASRDAQPDQQASVALELASFYFRQQLWAEAVQAYEAILGPQMPLSIRFHYVVALLNSGNHGKAYSVARTSRTDQGFSPDLAEVEARVCEYFGDLSEAISLLEELIARVPERAAHLRVQLATNHYRSGKHEQCRVVLSSVAVSELAGEADLLMQVAKLRHWLSMDCSIEFAYAGLAAGRARPEIVRAYLYISLARQEIDKLILAPPSASVGCRVILVRGADRRSVDLVDSDEPENPPNRVRPNSQLGRKLMGTKKGDEIAVGSEESYGVEEVQSKYVAALQDALRDYSINFPDDTAVRRVHFTMEDPTAVLAQLDLRHEFARGALRLYRERRMTMGTLASVLGEPLIDVWLALVGAEPAERVLAAEGNEPEIQFESAAVGSASEIVLEPTAILTLARLGKLPLLKERFGKVYAAQHMVDAFLEARNRDEFGPKRGGWAGKVEGRYVITDQPNTEHERKRAALLKGVIEYLIAEATVVPCRRQLNYPAERWTEFERVLGAESVASVALAADLGLPLYSDDLALRVIARGDWSASSFWTQRLFIDCLTRRLIGRAEYYDLVAQLIRDRYYFVQIDSAYLLRLFEKQGLTLSQEVLRGLDLLGEPSCSIESAVRVAAGVIAVCWRDAVPVHFRYMVLDAVLGSLTRGRSPHIVLQAFLVAVGQHLGYGSPAYLRIQQSIRLWRRILFR
jgi:tetratricopeptide (TPR) repeat protein